MQTKHHNFDLTKFTKRMGIVVFVIYIVLATLSLRGQLVSNAIELQEYDTYIVSEGDTIWEIANNVNIDKDIRAIIYDIQVANDMTSSHLDIGQVLKIPKSND